MIIKEFMKNFKRAVSESYRTDLQDRRECTKGLQVWEKLI